MIMSWLTLKAMSAFAAQHTFLTIAAGAVGTAATIVVVDETTRDPLLYDRLGKKLAFGAGVMLTPILAAEDLARLAGADIPPEGFFYNKEGKSIAQIWQESAPAPSVLPKAVRQVNEVMAALAKAKLEYEHSLRAIQEMQASI